MTSPTEPNAPDLGHEDYVADDLPEQQVDVELDEIAEQRANEAAPGDAAPRDDASGDDDLESLRRANAELKDKYLRLMAEFDNFRKRTARQRNEERATAAIGAMNAMLPVVDDFDRAKATAESDDNDEALSPGVELVYQKLKRVLKGLGLEQIESTGKPFDPELHEAFTEIPAPSPELAGTVVDTIEPGYTLNDKLIRHAKVVVGK